MKTNIDYQKSLNLSEISEKYGVNAPCAGDIVDGKVAMTRQDAERLGLPYMARWYSSYGCIALVSKSVIPSK